LSSTDLILKIEENDSGFTSNWSSVTNHDSGDLFSNSNLPDDPFFNKLTNIRRISYKIIDQAISIFQNNNLHLFVHVIDNPPLEDYLLEKGFSYHDTLHVLKNTSVPKGDFPIKKILGNDSKLWTEIFCNAYDCAGWLNEVNKIVQNSTSKVDYYVDSDFNASCVALYEKNSILGLYCLGTNPDKRKKGLAKLHVNHALNIVKEKSLNFLMLETFEKDRLLEFYSKLGFTKIYEKRIFTI